MNFTSKDYSKRKRKFQIYFGNLTCEKPFEFKCGGITFQTVRCAEIPGFFTRLIQRGFGWDQILKIYSIAVFEAQVEDPLYAVEEVAGDLISMLRLYKSGAHYLVGYEAQLFEDENFFSPPLDSVIELFGEKIVLGDSCKIWIQEISNLETFWKNYRARKHLIGNKAAVALNRLVDLPAKSPKVERLNYLFTTFQILTEPKQRLRHSISLRVASYIEKDSTSAEKIFDFMKKCYDLRSQSTHAGKVSDRDIQKMGYKSLEDINRVLSDYLRKILYRAIFEEGKLPHSDEWDNLSLAA